MFFSQTFRLNSRHKTQIVTISDKLHYFLALFFAGKRMEVTGLSPATTYFFYISAGNKVGFGKSIKLRVKTPRVYPRLSGTGQVPA